MIMITLITVIIMNVITVIVIILTFRNLEKLVAELIRRVVERRWNHVK